MGSDRSHGRSFAELRPVTIEPGFVRTADGSALYEQGETRVICTASVTAGVPRWLEGSTRGWVTAEYAMLPASTGRRKERDSHRGRPDGRAVEIQRLIGRALRAVVDLEALGERAIYVDCDVLQADGGTRCAAITGGWVALRLATAKLLDQAAVVRDPLAGSVAAVSCGIVDGEALCDLDYAEDARAEVDANVVMSGEGGLVEVQATAEQTPVSRTSFDELLALAEPAIASLRDAPRGQRDVAYDDMAGFAEFAGYPGTSMTIYDEVSTRRSLFFDMQTKKATIAGTDYIEDVSGNGNTGKLGSGVTLGAAGKVGLAATFPGSASGYVSASSRFVFATSAFTVAFWAYPTALPGSSTYFFGSTQAGGGDVIYGSQANGVLSCTLVNTLGGSYSTPSGALSLNNWNHVACTFDGSKLRLYLNGIEQGSGTSFVGAPRRPQADFRVGGYAGLTGVTGILDEFQVVLRGMNAQEISGLYGGAIGAAPGTITAFPSSNTGTCSGADNGDWVNPTNAYSDNGIYASAIAANGQTKCNTWTGFGINVPSWAIITSVTVQSDSFETSTEGQLTVHLGSGPCNDVIGGNATSDFTSCQAWKPSDFASCLDCSAPPDAAPPIWNVRMVS